MLPERLEQLFVSRGERCSSHGGSRLIGKSCCFSHAGLRCLRVPAFTEEISFTCQSNVFSEFRKWSCRWCSACAGRSVRRGADSCCCPRFLGRTGGEGPLFSRGSQTPDCTFPVNATDSALTSPTCGLGREGPAINKHGKGIHVPPVIQFTRVSQVCLYL